MRQAIIWNNGGLVYRSILASPRFDKINIQWCDHLHIVAGYFDAKTYTSIMITHGIRYQININQGIVNIWIIHTQDTSVLAANLVIDSSFQLTLRLLLCVRILI